MKKLYIVAIIACVLISGCVTGTSNLKISKLEIDRVDQTVKGNRGYLTGEAPAPVGPRKTKRTVISIDVEVPGDLYPLSTIVGIGKDLPEGTEAQEETSEVREEEWIK
jgi:hypothetical protein